MSSLAGKRVIVTRPADRADSLADRLREKGAIAGLYPTIMTGPPDDWDPLDEALGSLAAFDWIVFTSAAGVNATFQRADRTGILPALRSVRAAAVGPATASALEAWGHAAAAVPKTATGASIADAIPAANGARFLFIRGNLARDDAPDAVRQAGGHVHDVQAYATRIRNEVDAHAAELLKSHDAITFTSPSTLQGFLNALGPEPCTGVAIVTIGPTTSDAVRAARLTVSAEASPHTEEGLVSALRAMFAQES
jgi:uroporphyrinogen-III synthase